MITAFPEIHAISHSQRRLLWLIASVLVVQVAALTFVTLSG